MTWSNAASESTRKPFRPTQLAYIPPHLRNIGVSKSPYLAFPTTEQGRAGPSLGRGRGRGRGRGWFEQAERWSPRQSHTPFDIYSELNEGEVKQDDENKNGTGPISFQVYEDIPVQATGLDIPPPFSSFAEIDLGDGLNRNIKRSNYVRPTPIQRHAIPIAMAGRDLMACAQTGSGKTAAFCFPIIFGILKRKHFSRPGRVACPLAVILSPTRELSCQIHEEAKKFAYQTGVKIVVVYGGASMSQQLCNLERGVDILVATPGRLMDMIQRSRVSLRMMKFLALDEADRMLDMGFEPQIRKIVEGMDMPPCDARQTMLFSATFPDEMQRLASDFLSNYIFVAVGRVGSSTDLIAQRVEFVQDKDKRHHLMNLLRGQRAKGAHGKYSLTLVFVETKKGADALQRWLSMNGFRASAIHGDKVQMERERALKSFKSGSTPILVATDVASRGLDVPRVGHVINFDLPKDIDDYVHRIGRTGRAGKCGLATAFFSEKNLPLAKALVELMREASQEVPVWLSKFAERSSPTGSGGRTRQFLGSKFGGYDFRGDAQSETKNDYYSSTYANTGPSHAAASSNGPSHVAAADSYATAGVGSYGYGFRH